MKYSESRAGLKWDEKSLWDNHISRRWSQLRELEEKWWESYLKFTLLTNSGGAVALLGFIGASKIGLAPTTIFSLIAFLLGLAFSGGAHLLVYLKMDGLYKNYKIDVAAFQNDEMEWEELLERDQKRVNFEMAEFWLPLFSFCSFVVGCIFGVTGLIQL